MTLKQLEAFYWAATCASFATAAQRLNLSISSLSKRIAELEASLGVPLFDRSGHKATLSAAGHNILDKSLGILDLAADLRSSATGDKSLLAGHCALGVGELAAMSWLPRLVATARLRHPRLLMETSIDVGARLEERLDQGELDFIVVAGRSSRATILSQPIVEAQFLWMAAPSLANEGSSCSALLDRGIPLVALPAQAGTTRLIDDWLMAHHITRAERLTCNNWGAIVGMLTLAVGVGIVPAGWADRLEQKGQLRRLETESLLSPFAYSFQWRRGDTRPLVDEMCALVGEVADFSQPVIFA
ncbi:LysR family transcriptional regulator [Sphingomonas sp.]|uniref:LysR family transcriptional regulator n=1 Tax=Sphingomonas sp. TaxID=28214 RepID=UPI002DD69712|nr:LysR family transcriptional regulator [Sphingomonas sp.]